MRKVIIGTTGGGHAPACRNAGFECRSGEIDWLLSYSWLLVLRNGLWFFGSVSSFELLQAVW